MAEAKMNVTDSIEVTVKYDESGSTRLLQEHVEQLRSENLNLVGQRDDLDDQLRRMQKKIDQLTSANLNLTGAYSEQTGRLDREKEAVARLRKHNDELSESAQSLRFENQELRRAEETARGETANLKNKLGQAEFESYQLRRSMEAEQQRTADMADLRAQRTLSELANEMAGLKDRLTEAQRRTRLIANQRDARSAELMQQDTKIKELEAKVRELEARIKELEEHPQINVTVTDPGEEHETAYLKVAELERQLRDSRSEMWRAIERENEQRQLRGEAQREQERLSGVIASMRANLDGLTKQNGELLAENQTIGKLRREIAAANAEIEKVNRLRREEAARFSQDRDEIYQNYLAEKDSRINLVKENAALGTALQKAKDEHSRCGRAMGEAHIELNASVEALAKEKEKRAKLERDLATIKKRLGL